MVDRLSHQTSESLPGRDSETNQAPQESNTHTEKVSTPMLLLMAGFAGAGKTTLARWLKDSFDKLGLKWKMLSKDDLKLAHLKLGEEIEQAGWHAFEDLFELVKQELEERRSLIIDTSNEKPFIFENITRVTKQLEQHQIQTHMKVILCVAG